MTFRPTLPNLSELFDRRSYLAILSGALIALSFPNTGLSFLAWVALVPLLAALENCSVKTAFRVGFTCGITAYAALLYWINIVVTQYGRLPWAMSIPVYLALVIWLAMFTGLTTLATRFAENSGIKAALTLPVAWVTGDLLRSFLLTGFPWAMLGHSQYRTLPLIQIADICGVYGITLLIVLGNAVLYRAIRAISSRGTGYPVKSALVLLMLLISTLFYGFNRLNHTEQPESKPLRVTLVQGNIDQDIKWSPAFQEQTLRIYEKLTREGTGKGVDLIVWPESAVPFFLQDEPVFANRLKKLAFETSAALLTGSPAHEKRNGITTYLNSAFVIAPNGEIVGRSDKLHLVPFGEYVPLGRFLPFIKKIVVGIGDFSPGLRAEPLRVDHTTVGTLVCFEAIFPEVARAYVNNGARILVNITNDAWFGRSSAPYQHLSIAVFRTVETRTPMLRAANTGVTAIIDQNGHIGSMTELFREDFRTGEIRPGSGKSLYLKIGDLPAGLCALLTAVIIMLAWSRQRKTASADNDKITNKELHTCSEKKPHA
ncbi:MAG TPA: apolipoprotein N-acyltransferase [Deltaproteobacteria bacterium]|nr:apolipoprotein N-acyltransferase [Deltaproteobacteria bacterium]